MTLPLLVILLQITTFSLRGLTTDAFTVKNYQNTNKWCSSSANNQHHHGVLKTKQNDSRCRQSSTCVSMSSSSVSGTPTTSKEELRSAISSNLSILYRAAESKQEDSETVLNALTDLEKNMRSLAKQDTTVADAMETSLNGDWRLVFTTGTKQTQNKFGSINYFPVKAVQSFRTVQKDPMLIENGIYFGDWAALKFQGTMDFDKRKRRLEFDFDTLTLFGLFDISLGTGEAAQLGAKSGLGSDSNVKNAERDRKAFFNWISADDKIATARGGGGGLALWKRVG